MVVIIQPSQSIYNSTELTISGQTHKLHNNIYCIFTHSTIGTSPGNFTQIWYSSYIYIELANYMDIFLYFQNFPKISIYKQSYGIIRIRESSLSSEGIPSYWN